MPDSPHADPTRGLFETLLVHEGAPVEVDAHVERLAGSLTALFGVGLPGDAASRIAAGARPLRRGRLRLTAAPTSVGRVELSIWTAEVEEVEVFPPAGQGAALRSFVVEGGLGAHKWADRSLLDRLGSSTAGSELPLLLDRGEEVLETSRANVFAVRGGTVLTPPADGRIVPGIARMRTVQLARSSGREVREERLSLADLLAADEVFLTNSVRGIEPVHSIDGHDVPQARGHYGRSERRTSLRAELTRELRRRWLRVPEAGFAAGAAGARRVGRPAR